MHTSEHLITGAPSPHFSEQEIALAQFYSAFNNRNLEAMEAALLTTSEASMDNPIGGIRRGWGEIRGGYEKIFSGRATVYVEFYDYTVHGNEEWFFATGRERGFFRTAEKELSLAIRTTRIFTKQEGGWKQIHHHGSIDSPDLLKDYQAAVLGG